MIDNCAEKVARYFLLDWLHVRAASSVGECKGCAQPQHPHVFTNSDTQLLFPTLSRMMGDAKGGYLQLYYGGTDGDIIQLSEIECYYGGSDTG